MSRFFNSGLQSLEPYTPGEQPKTVGRLIKLNTNENPYGPSPKAVSALRNADADHLMLYPDPDGTDLTKAIAEECGVRPEQIMLGNGSDEILAFLFMGFGDEIWFPKTSYGFYPVFSDVFRCDAHTVPLEDDLSIDLGKYMDAKGTIVIPDPNAPTGRELSPDAIEELVRAKSDCLVVVDEAYVDFGAETCAPLIDKYDNVMIIRTLSKSRGLAGLRVGWCMGCEDIIADMKRLKFSFNPYNVDRIALAVAEAAVKDKEYFEEIRQKIIGTRERFTEQLTEMGFSVLPSKTNFVFAQTGRMPGAELFRKLRERNIIVRYFDKDPIKNYIRITIGKDEDMDAFIENTKEIFEEAGK